MVTNLHAVVSLGAVVFASLCQVQAQTIDRDRIYFVTNAATDNLRVFKPCCDPTRPPDPVLHDVTTIRTVNPPGVSAPYALYVDGEHFLWIIDYTNDTVSKFIAPPANANTLLVFRVDLGQGVRGPTNLAFDADGHAWVTCNKAGDHGVIRIDKNTAAVTEVVRRSVFGSPWPILAHSNRHFYVGCVDAQNVTRVVRLERVGNRWFESEHADLSALGLYVSSLAEAPNGDIWACSWEGHRLVLVAQAGGVLSSTSIRIGSEPRWPTNLLCLPLVGGGSELWCGAQDGANQRLGLRQFNHSGGVFTDNGWVHRGQPPLTVLGTPLVAADGRCRVWCTEPDGLAWFTPLPRTPAFAGRVFTIAQPPSSAARYGDPTGMARALSVDRGRDDDGDGFANFAEVAQGSNPFDAASIPGSRSSLAVTSPVPIGGAATLTLHGTPGEQFVLFAGTRLTTGIPYLNWGVLWIDPATLFFLLDPRFLLSAIPSQGWIALTVGVPNDPGLRGMRITTQALTLPVGRPPSFSNDATLAIQ